VYKIGRNTEAIVSTTLLAHVVDPVLLWAMILGYIVLVVGHILDLLVTLLDLLVILWAIPQ
jgi:hypothetical protein